MSFWARTASVASTTVRISPNINADDETRTTRSSRSDIANTSIRIEVLGEDKRAVIRAMLKMKIRCRFLQLEWHLYGKLPTLIHLFEERWRVLTRLALRRLYSPNLAILSASASSKEEEQEME